jgi:eukaryotic-like serine/threonine-protein kinase
MNDFSDADSSLALNTQVGHYQILDRIGAGGMGVVYKASDTKLDRLVALKVVRRELLDAEGLGRLEREARVLASLNHPRVAAIYGLEEFGDTRFLVLEYVPGLTLADRLRRGGLPVREAISVATQIAEALEAAHASGIIHRDLKPGNIKVTEDGAIKVLDFGLAKSIETPHAVSHDSGLTMTAVATRAMTVLGTAAYMSPEQACGKKLDTRTDIWSFGCVLYEALTGKAAFRGDTVTEVLAAAIEREPEWNALPPATPPTIVSLLHRCLRKDPKNRLRDIGDARIELEDALSGPSPAVATSARVTRRTAIGALAGAALGAAAATGTFAIGRRSGVTSRRLTRIPIPFPEGMVAVASANNRVGISPAGTYVAFNVTIPGTQNQPKLFLRPLAALESRMLPVPVGNTPFFSPDEKWLGFLGDAPRGVRRLALSGGAPVLLCQTESSTGATWADDDTIYYVATSPGAVLRIASAGGQPQEAVKIDFTKGERGHRHPYAVPGTRTILFTSLASDAETFDDARIVGFDTRSGRRQTLVEGGTHPRYSPSGHLVYARGGNLLAVRFDPAQLAISGQPFTALEGVLMSLNSGAANFDISASGDLVYIPGLSDKADRTLVWVDRNGRAEPLPLPPRSYLHPRFSPDGRQLAIEIEGPNHDLYLYDFARAVLAKMTTDGESHWPVWSPDGTRLAYRSGHMAAWRMWELPADRSHAAQQLPGNGVSQSAESWSPDGRVIAYTATTNEPGSHIMVTSLEDRQSHSIVDIRATAGSPKFSPDGRWLAYCSSESGTPHVYVQAFPGPGAKIQVSADGGTDPVWKRTGGEIYFRNGDKMMAVSVSTAPTFTAGRPQKLWEGRYSHGMSASCGPAGATSSNYDVTPDGARFLMVKDEAPDKAISKQFVVVLGWADELTRISSRS